MVISHNMAAMNTNRQLGIVTPSKAKSTEKLSSGYKINRAADDAAGLSISEKMRSLIRGLDRGSENIQDGVSLVQIADGALAEVNDMLHRITELSVQSANGTNSQSDRDAIQKEVSQIIKEIDRIHETVKFNETYLFDGDEPMVGEGNLFDGLVKCESAEAGKMVQNYNGKAAAILDFSTINGGNISKLYNQTFSFGCTASCSETFRFTFTTGTGSKITTPGDTLNHNFNIDISGMSSGAQIVDEVWNTVNKAKNDGTLKLPGSQDPSYPPGIAVGHANGFNKASDTSLVVYSGSRAADFYINNPDNAYGNVDATGIMGDAVGRKGKSLKIQCSNGTPDNILLKLERMNADYIGVKDIDVSTYEGSLSAINTVNAADQIITTMRSRYGAYQNRLESSYDNNQNKLENTQAAESRIRDTDMAKEMVKFTKDNILQQATESMLAQANQSTQGVLSLLQ